MTAFPSFRTLITASALVLSLSSCATLQQFAALKEVDFAIDRVAGVTLAGIQMDQVRSYNDLRLLDTARITAALAQNQLPLTFTIHVAATNPADNSVSARMVGFDWSLLLDDRETIAGTVNQPQQLTPGVAVDIPISIELNLIEFFDRNAADLFNLAQVLSGSGGRPSNIALKAQPTIETPIGPIRYPNPITVVSRQVGG